MKLTSPKNISFHKKKRFNPQQFWVLFCSIGVTTALVLIGYFSWYFVETTQVLDAPVTATFETNSSKIMSMQKSLDETEAAVAVRTGMSMSQQ